jgi:hypothetical protein
MLWRLIHDHTNAMRAVLDRAVQGIKQLAEDLTRGPGDKAELSEQDDNA